MRIDKRIGFFVLFGIVAGSLFAQQRGLDAQMPRMYFGIGAFMGEHESHIVQDDWANAYLNALNSTIGKIDKAEGNHTGYNFSIGCFLGKKRLVGLGTGLQYLQQNTTLNLNAMQIEYQSVDNFGNIFRQGIRANKGIEERVQQDIWGVPVMLLLKKQVTKRWGLYLDGGLVFTLKQESRFEATGAMFDYEAIYKRGSDGKMVYDNSVLADPNSWLITKEHYGKVNTAGDVNVYFEDLYKQGYNVGLDVDALENSGEVKNAVVNTTWFVRGGLSYRIMPKVALHANFMYQQMKTSYENSADYRITDKRGTYSSMTRGIKSSDQGLMSVGLGLRFYIGKGRGDKEEARATSPSVAAAPPATPALETPAPVVAAPAPVAAPLVVTTEQNTETVKVMVKVMDEKYGMFVAGNIAVKSGSELVYNEAADNSGLNTLYLVPGEYVVNVTAKGYIPAEENLVLQVSEKGTTKLITMKQPKIEQGLEFKLNSINFKTSSNRLTTSSFGILDRMADILKENPQLVVEIAGYTDNVGDAKTNLDLSQNRALAVQNYLIEKGVMGTQLRAVGFGEKKPIADNKTPAGRKLNRRVIFKVIAY